MLRIYLLIYLFFFLVLSCLFFLVKSSLFLGLDFLRRNSGTQKERLFNCLKRKRREKKNVNWKSIRKEQVVNKIIIDTSINTCYYLLINDRRKRLLFVFPITNWSKTWQSAWRRKCQLNKLFAWDLLSYKKARTESCYIAIYIKWSTCL